MYLKLLKQTLEYICNGIHREDPLGGKTHQNVLARCQGIKPGAQEYWNSFGLQPPWCELHFCDFFVTMGWDLLNHGAQQICALFMPGVLSQLWKANLQQKTAATTIKKRCQSSGEIVVATGPCGSLPSQGLDRVCFLCQLKNEKTGKILNWRSNSGKIHRMKSEGICWRKC